MTAPTIATCPLCGDPSRVFRRLVDVGLVCDGCRSRLVALVAAPRSRGWRRIFDRPQGWLARLIDVDIS